MSVNQFYLAGHLYRFNYSGDAPPWPFEVWNDDEQTWQVIGTKLSPSGLLTAAPNTLNVLSANWLTDASGNVITTGAGVAISCDEMRAVGIPEFILSADGDVIATQEG